ncbi:MAG TPA: MFS transporter [Pirellulales bacterium]
MTATAATEISAPARPAYKWWVVGMLWCVCFFNYADRQSIVAVFPVLSTEFGFDKVELGLIGSAFMWVYALGAPLAGFIGDRVRRKDLILGGCLAWSFVTVMTGRCSRLWQFVTVRAAEGLGETFYLPASMSLLSDYHGRRTRSLAMSLHQSSVYLGTIGGSWLGALFAERYGWRVGFYFFGGAGMLLSLVLYKFLREPERGAADADRDELAAHGVRPENPLSAKETALAICRAPVALLLMAVFLGANFVATIFLTWTPTFLVEKFHFGLSSAGLSGSVYIHLASALSVPLAGVLADRLARRFAGGRIAVQALGLLVGSVFVFLVGITPTVSTLLVAMACFGFCKGFYDSNIFASLYDCIEPRARASAAGVMNCIGWGGGALGPLVVGLVARHGRHASEMDNMSEAIASCGVIYLIGAAALIVAIVLSQRGEIGRRKTGTEGREGR